MWHWGPFVGADTETTDPNPLQARLVQWGGATLRSDGKIEPFSMLVNSLVPIPKEATEVHGITDAMVTSDGVPADVALAEIRTMLVNCAEVGLPVVIYNAPYDLTVIDCELERWGMEGLTFDLPPIIDPLCLINAATAWKRSHTLARACEVYEIPLPKAHDASSDGIAAARLTWRLAENLKVVISAQDRGEDVGTHGRNVNHDSDQFDPKVTPLKEVPLDVLQRAQARWYRNSALGFIANQRSKGREPENVNHDWPIMRRPRLVRS